MLTMFYEFHVLRGKEDEFRRAWADTTRYIYENFGSLGSRLHRDEHGRFVAYAQWPDEASFDAEHDWCPRGLSMSAAMRATLDPAHPTTARRLYVDTDLLQDECHDERLGGTHGG